MRKKTDKNQQEIMDALRKIGASVSSLHTVGCGIPDLLVGYRGKNYLIEVKADKGKLTPAQIEFHGAWRGEIHIVRTAEEAINRVMPKSAL